MDTATASTGLFSGGQVAPARMTIARRIARSPSFLVFMVTSFAREGTRCLSQKPIGPARHNCRPRTSIDLQRDQRPGVSDSAAIRKQEPLQRLLRLFRPPDRAETALQAQLRGRVAGRGVSTICRACHSAGAPWPSCALSCRPCSNLAPLIVHERDRNRLLVASCSPSGPKPLISPCESVQAPSPLPPAGWPRPSASRRPPGRP